MSQSKKSRQAHYAAVNIIKNQMRMSDSDYRALLMHLTGKQSLKQMSIRQLNQVRDHMNKLAEKMGVAQTRSKAWQQNYERASPMERKVWALWGDLRRRGVIRDSSARALRAWVQRQTDAADLRFCTDAQLSNLIEALKEWEVRTTQEDVRAAQETAK